MKQTLPHFAKAMLMDPIALAGERDDAGRTTDQFRLNALADFAQRHDFRDIAAAISISERPVAVTSVVFYVMGDDPFPIEWSTEGAVSIADVCLMIRQLETAMAIASLNVPQDDHCCMEPIFLKDGSMLTTDLDDPSTLTPDVIVQYGLEGDLSYLISQKVEGWQEAVLWSASDSLYAEEVRLEGDVLIVDLHPH